MACFRPSFLPSLLIAANTLDPVNKFPFYGISIILDVFYLPWQNIWCERMGLCVTPRLFYMHQIHFAVEIAKRISSRAPPFVVVAFTKLVKSNAIWRLRFIFGWLTLRSFIITWLDMLRRAFAIRAAITPICRNDLEHGECMIGSGKTFAPGWVLWAGRYVINNNYGVLLQDQRSMHLILST